MKKMLMLLALPALLLTACGEEAGETTDETTSEGEISTEGMVELDLGEHGLPLKLMVPVESHPTTGDPLAATVEAYPDDFIWHVRVGEKFHLIIEDMGDSENHIAGVKAEHASVNNIYDISYVVDDADAILWAQTIPGSGLEDGKGNLKAFYHVQVFKTIDGIAYQVYTDQMDENSEVRGKQLLASAQSVSSNAPA